MEKNRLNMKDYRILNIFDDDPNVSLSKLAKKIRMSIQATDYRVNRLLKQKTIYSFFTLIDLGKLGYTLFRVHIKLKNANEDLLKEFSKNLFEDYPTFWVAFVSGSFDIIIDIWSKNANEFEKLFSKILDKHKYLIYSYEINPILELDIYAYGYFLKETGNREKVVLFRNDSIEKIDDKDRKILQTMKGDSRLAYEVIGKKVDLTRNAVKYRIKNLENKKIIAGYKMMVDFKHFDRLTYKIFIKYDNSKINQEKLLLEYLKKIPGILSTTKHLGRWNLDIEIEPRNAKELQSFIMMLRSKFSIVENYEFIQILEDYGLDFFPEKLN